MTAGISSIPGKPALIEGVNELEGERLNSPPKLGGVPARPSSSTKGRAGGVVPKQVVARFYLGTTPSAPALVTSRHFINGAATPPNLGGELSRLPIHSQHPRLRRFGMGRFSYWRSHPSCSRRGTPSPHDLRSPEEKSVTQREQALCPGALCV